MYTDREREREREREKTFSCISEKKTEATTKKLFLEVGRKVDESLKK